MTMGETTTESTYDELDPITRARTILGQEVDRLKFTEEEAVRAQAAYDAARERYHNQQLLVKRIKQAVAEMSGEGEDAPDEPADSWDEKRMDRR